ncbi:peroxisomal membrane protein PEX14 isoform X2 [Zootermopsis nevadensis]|uniref:Peroxisomal membrane protein PEX14 n=1 Tax=Zootermopsis nevadensis TaxID=136037 RepID=A0A067REZ6_ZOONE|nr:peroxisomal membrane protein PEX14 isoform X2 [Zootermopsis nevadensis]KDR22342.1 Peroxisomal membrane protein PEX14 [Zootermopsis nevadensis]
MAENDTSGNAEKQLPKPREDLIGTAVKFLQNPNVQKSSLTHQQAFLKKKGLTDEEVQIACERAGCVGRQSSNLQTVLQHTPVPVTSLPPPYVLHHQSVWSKFRDTLNTIAVIGGIAYGIYWFYKKFVEPFLFGVKEKKKSIEDSISEMNEGLNKVHVNLERICDQQQQQPEQSASMSKQIQELKGEIATVKGLLLSRHQFPAATSSNPLVPPSIPAWQLSSSPQATDGDEGEQGQKEGDMEVCTSGSGSSENEVVINTGSDSSLEMIRE